MSQELTLRSVSRKLIELSSSRPELHSFNRQFVRLLIDATNALGVTLWLVHQNELIRSEELEQEVGSVSGIGLSMQAQQNALRGAFEENKISILKNPAQNDGMMLGDVSVSEERRIVFLPITGMKANFGVIRLVLQPMPDDSVAKTVQLAEAISGYYALYAAERVLQIQHHERQEIDRLSKAILQLQHYTFSKELPDVVVNSALEISPHIDRVTLLEMKKDGDLRVAGVSSVSQPDRKSAWAKLLRDLGLMVLRRGEPVHHFPRAEVQEKFEDAELEETINSYTVMTNATSLLMYPLKMDDESVGVVVFESFQQQPLGNFERMLCTVFAAHVASALGNQLNYRRIPFVHMFAGALEDPNRRQKRGRKLWSTPAKLAVAGVCALFVLWIALIHRVPETISSQCFVAPYESRVVTAQESGEVEEVLFGQGDRVVEGQLLLRLKTQLLDLELTKAIENIKGIEANIRRLSGQDVNEKVLERRSQLRAEMRIQEHAREAARKEADILRERIANCTLRSPLAGIVIGPESPDELLGVVVRPGEPLVEIGSVREQVMVRIAVPEEDAPRIAEGQSVEITLQPIVTKDKIKGIIKHVASRTTTYKSANVLMADVLVPNRSIALDPESESRDFLLKPGMTGKARIETREKATYFSIYYGIVRRKVAYWLF